MDNRTRIKHRCISGTSLELAPRLFWRGAGVESCFENKEINERYRLAEQAREWAEEAADRRVRADYLTVERSWLLLGRSRKFSERLTRLTNRDSEIEERRK